MSGFKGIMKDGWHPKSKDGAKESWRGDFKGINQVVSGEIWDLAFIARLLINLYCLV